MTADSHPYRGAKIALATLHGKHDAIAPPFSVHVAARVIIAQGVDTDSLGTFTGETPRLGTMADVALQKAQLAVQATSVSLGLGSEGSYGPHPHFYFIPGGVEVLTLFDADRRIMVSESLIVDQTNFGQCTTEDGTDIDQFLDRVQFPSHAVIVSPAEGNGPFMKGIRNRDDLLRAIRRASRLSNDGAALVQTDMRAHMNPTRMNEIGRLANKLAQRISTLCPACGAPGFGAVGSERGLPCTDCGTPTNWVIRTRLGCAACDYTLMRARSDGLERADPMYCPECNP